MNKILLTAAMLLAVVAAAAQHIAVLSDIHVSPGNANEQQLRLAVDEINAQPFDFVMLIGDLANEGSDRELTNVKSILDDIKHPFYLIPGNHESTWSQSATKTFFDLWGKDRFVIDTDSTVIIAIASGPYMKMGDGHIKTEDLAWMTNTLDSLVTEGKRVLSVNHYPLNADLDNLGQYMAVLNRYPVFAHINGHYHVWQQYRAGDGEATVPGIMLRALDMRNGDYGYTILDIDRDWMHVYNKEIGKRAQAKFAIPVSTDHLPLYVGKFTSDTPEGFAIDKLWADDASIFGRVTADAGNIYFGNSLGQLRALSKVDNQLAWSIPSGAAVFARPTVLKNGNVAFPTPEGLTIVSPKGKVVKEYPSKEGPYVADGVLTPRGWAQGGYKRFEMRNASNGKLIWSYDSLNNYAQAAPAVGQDDIIFGAWDTKLRSLRLKDGKLNWAWDNGKANNLFSPGNVVPHIAGEQVIIVAPDRFMTAIDRRTGKTLWRDNSHRYRESLGTNPEHTVVYAKTMDGELVAVDATAPEFRELWTVDMGIGYDHAPCIVIEHDGVVYAGSRRGIITAVDPATHTVLWSLPLGSSEVNGFDVDPVTGDLYASMVEGVIFRIRKK